MDALANLEDPDKDLRSALAHTALGLVFRFASIRLTVYVAVVGTLGGLVGETVCVVQMVNTSLPCQWQLSFGTHFGLVRLGALFRARAMARHHCPGTVGNPSHLA